MSNVPHQKLIDGLGYHVLRGEVDKKEAEELIADITRAFPDDDSLDEATLWQIRKDWGLDAPAT